MQGFLVKQQANAPLSRPPVLTDVIFGRALSDPMILQLSRTPGFELIANLFTVMGVRGNHDMAMIRTAIDGMQKPMTYLTML